MLYTWRKIARERVGIERETGEKSREREEREIPIERCMYRE